MEFEKKNEIPEGIKILGWLISLIAFAFGFYHTADGLKCLLPLGYEGGAYIFSALITMMLILAYSRAIAGVKAALFFYLFCALFNFTFNLNSFYPNLNSRKLLQEEAKLINDTITSNRAITANLIEPASQLDLTNMDLHRTQCINEIIKSEGFGDSAQSELSRFNNISNIYGIKPISPGSFGVKNKNADEVFGDRMDSIIKKIRQGQSKLPSETAFTAFEEFLALTAPTKKGSTKLSFIDSLFYEINTKDSKKNKDTAAFKKSVDNLGRLVTKNDETAISINKLNLKDTLGKDIKLIVFNKDKKAQLLYPKSKEIGNFAHTLSSMWQRIDKIDTWGPISLAFVVDFFVPFGIYFMIRKKKNSGEDNGMVNGSNRGFFARLFGKAQPTKF
jgi:hypothetical protein